MAISYMADCAPLRGTVNNRVTTRTVIFVRSFLLNEADGELPPGIYTVETEEELLESVFFPAWRRVSTVMHCQAASGITRFATVNPAVLEAALARDARVSD